ncbi:nitroreductase family protein [Halieaceae bacterium IMCC14734]|uniref:Nitroreductase family protein n=1 Tax=Candidatus Litorirhabdus singularis TaxID=2518993 RepID=A0ABT3TJW9_9GAMM|nr:nitroreductase family protein [Candidatus Litorirhabdus singularis]MCX2982584.1 nitroreductase family protein [Candidatus Litorirhabdus singularis]
MELYETMRSTFSARQYTGEDMSDELLYQILENARFAPSGGNRQAGKIIVVRDKPLQAAIADLSLETARRYTAQSMAGETPYSPIHETALTAEQIAAVEPLPQLTDHLRNASVLLAVCLDLGSIAALDKDLDRISLASGGSIYPLVWNILMAARAEGFGGTMTTISLAVEPAVKELLNVPEDWALATLVPIGKPVKQLTRLKRKAVEEFVVRDRFDGAPFAQ